MSTAVLETNGESSATRAPGPGDPARFEEIYNTYYGRIFAYVYNRVSNVELARDLTAEVFEKAFCKGNTVRDQGAYTAWLFMITRNTVSAHFRKRKREFNGISRVGESLSLHGQEIDPSDHLLRDEQAARLREHLRKLPSRLQEILALKFDAELSNREIGQLLGMSEVNVRVTVFRALSRLREGLKEDSSDAVH
ncbi:MAG: sigma-70 family RNA polymerase sigma factor [Chloroflexi bacterium]|nr:sigma-70 family RNA polymerase sigma factor [Chloroflexota bacterium]